jgi:hypothetical protein
VSGARSINEAKGGWNAAAAHTVSVPTAVHARFLAVTDGFLAAPGAQHHLAQRIAEGAKAQLDQAARFCGAQPPVRGPGDRQPADAVTLRRISTCQVLEG